MKYQFSQRSLSNMEGVHPALIGICWRALSLSPLDFGITEGRRTRRRQEELVAQGASQTLNSRHLTGHAIDFAVYDPALTWDFDKYEKVSAAFFEAADEYDVPIVWGGHWSSFKDGPHIELDRGQYP